MLENLLIFALVGMGVMSFSTMVLAFLNLKLQDENDRLKIENISSAPPF